MSEEPARSPLHEYFRSAGARFAERHGWLLPAEVAGFEKEYQAIRDGAAAVDLSWQAQLLVGGAEAEEAVAELDPELAALPLGGVRRIRAGEEATAEGALVVRTGPATFLVLAESFRAARLRRVLERTDLDVRVEERRGRAAVLLLLGPKVPELVHERFREELPRPFAPGSASLFPFHGFRSLLVPSLLAGTPAAFFVAAPPVVQHLLDELRSPGLALAGTDAYECWRLERGLPLASEDLEAAALGPPARGATRIVTLLFERDPGSDLLAGEHGVPLGRIAAWRRSPSLDGVVALAVIEDRADLGPGAALDAGSVRGVIVEPPLVRRRSNADVDPEHP